MSIYRAYDIRGVYPSELNGALAYKIALAYATFLKPKRVVLGMDLRRHSKELHDSLAKGLRDMGVDVTTIGPCTTPMVYFASSRFDGAIMVTASHLPGKFNGIKLCRENCIPLSGRKGINKIRRLVEKNKFSLAKKRGKLVKKNITKQYHSFIERFSKKSNLKIAIDCNYGMGGLDLPLLKKLGNVIALHTKPNFHKPGHIPDPLLKKARAQLVKTVKKNKCDLGIIFDGDCDRVGFIDARGRFILPDQVTGILASYLLDKSKRKEPIVYEVRTTLAVQEIVRMKKGVPLLSAAGRTFIREKMIKHDGLFGGEKSGHYFFRSLRYADNALLAAVMLIKCLSEKKQSLKELAQPFEKYAQMQERNFHVSNQDLALANIEKHFKRRAKKIKKIDGLSIYLKDGWFNLRKSNTEPVIRLNAEASNKEALQRIQKEVMSVING